MRKAPLIRIGKPYTTPTVSTNVLYTNLGRGKERIRSWLDGFTICTARLDLGEFCWETCAQSLWFILNEQCVMCVANIIGGLALLSYVIAYVTAYVHGM